MKSTHDPDGDLKGAKREKLARPLLQSSAAHRDEGSRTPCTVRATVIPPNECVWIDDLEEEGYRVVRPFRVQISRVEAGHFEASLREANIAISGTDRDDAYQALVAEILDTFDLLAEERNLIPKLVDQLQILRKYIVQVQG